MLYSVSYKSILINMSSSSNDSEAAPVHTCGVDNSGVYHEGSCVNLTKPRLIRGGSHYDLLSEADFRPQTPGVGGAEFAASASFTRKFPRVCDVMFDSDVVNIRGSVLNAAFPVLIDCLCDDRVVDVALDHKYDGQHKIFASCLRAACNRTLFDTFSDKYAMLCLKFCAKFGFRPDFYLAYMQKLDNLFWYAGHRLGFDVKGHIVGSNNRTCDALDNQTLPIDYRLLESNILIVYNDTSAVVIKLDYCAILRDGSCKDPVDVDEYTWDGSVFIHYTFDQVAVIASDAGQLYDSQLKLADYYEACVKTNGDRNVAPVVFDESSMAKYRDIAVEKFEDDKKNGALPDNLNLVSTFDARIDTTRVSFGRYYLIDSHPRRMVATTDHDAGSISIIPKFSDGPETENNLLYLVSSLLFVSH